MRKSLITALFAGLALTAGAQVPTVEWDKHSLIIDGRRVCPVMGEVHYSRIPAQEWETEVRKMKEGGVTMIACYVFWNHIEEIENQFDWSGQRNPHYFTLRKLHLFMQDWGDVLAPMEAVFPCEQDIKKGDDKNLRWSYRAKDGKGFIFVNNYERLQNLTSKRGVRLEACGVKLPKLKIPAGAMCIFPVNIDGIRYATGQLIARRDGKIYMEQIKGIPTTIAIDGRVLKNLKPKGTEKPVYKNIYLLTSEQAERAFLSEEFFDERSGKAERRVKNWLPLLIIVR